MSDADRLFAKIDKDKSGTIDADELLKHLLEAGVEADEISRAFAAIDTDGDGAITKEEWTAGYARYLAADETLDPTTPLKAPHFHHARRVAALVLGPAGGGDSTTGADIRLLSARKLVAHIDGGGKMEIRQTFEAAGTDVFLDAATVRGLLPELETKNEFRCTFSAVVALSYAWVTPADPDPKRAQLLQLRPVLVWWMCERARRKTVKYNTYSLDATIQTADFGVFIDFMSMFQPDDTTGAKPAYTKPAEQASFGRALRNIGLLYGHAGTVVFKLTKTPLPAGGDADRVYGRRGWCHLERRLGDLEAPASNSLDVSAWPTAEAERAAMMNEEDKKKKYGYVSRKEFNLLSVENPTAAQRGPPQLRESEEELAAQGDYYDSYHPGTLGALIGGGRGAPVSPDHFEEELKEKVFSFDADRTVCAGLYRGVAEPLLAGVEELNFGKLKGWTTADWRHMGGALACCPKLRKLDLTGMGADDAAMAAFGGALGRGAAPALEVLRLSKNEIGDEGARHLADALARGAAPALQTLYLGGNQIGDEGARHLGDALARGAAPKLKTLFLSDNKIGDEGVRHLGDALARGAAPALETLGLTRNPAEKAAQQAVRDALKNRK